MMQMQAGAINLSCSPLLRSPDAKDVLSPFQTHIYTLTLRRYPRTLPSFLSTAASCYTRPLATWKINQVHVM